MYQIFADGTLIYDSALDDYKIGKGQITKEADKSGSFVFSLYPDHFYYNGFVKLKTVVMVRKSGKVAFRGRVLNDVTDYWNKGDFTCEGELGFLQDSVIRPFEFTGTPEDLFKKFIEEHNAQVDEFKRFKIGTCTVVDPNNYINRSTTDYPKTLEVMQSALTGSDLGGHFYITHGDDGTEELPTIHYVADFQKTATQSIEFGVNLKDYTKTTKAEDVATAVIPLGTQTGSDGQRLTIADVNDGVDYLYNAEAVAARGWVFKTVVWDDVTLADNLKTKGQAWLDNAINLAVTIELTAVDMHLLDRSIESYNVCEYVHATSQPHGFDTVMLCNRQTMDLLQPANDTVTLGYQTTTFTGTSTQMAVNVSGLGKQVSSIKQDAASIKLTVEEQGESIASLKLGAESIESRVEDAEGSLTSLEQKVDGFTLTVTNGDTSSSFVLKSGETVLSSGNITFDGFVTITGLANGTTEINGGCIKTGEILADLIKAGILQSKDGETFKLDLDKGTFSMHGSGRFQSSDGKTYIELEGNELVLYSSKGTSTGNAVDKLRIGFISGTSPDGSTAVDYPYMLLGNSGSTVGMIKEFYNGLWLGNSVPKTASGNFEGMEGAAGFFINTRTGVVYVVNGTDMQNVYTGAAVAKFA